jgi:dienelactone hydrolase
MRIVLALVATLILSAAQAEVAKIKWHPSKYSAPWVPGDDYIDGWTKNFMNGTLEEHGKTKLDGELDAEIMIPKGTKGPIPFVILLHGCSGLSNLVKKTAHEYGGRLVGAGYGVLILDSFRTRGVAKNEGICGDPSQLGWARRRADDAYSALDYLIEKRLAIPNKVYVVGRSNGATTTLLIMNQVIGDLHEHKFAGGFPMQPSCLYMNKVEYYAPVHQFLAEKDDATSPTLCTAMASSKRKIPVKTTLFKGAYHSYEDKVAPYVFHGWHLGYNAAAAEGTINAIIKDLNAER